ncbi:hypothetical protein V8J36_02285 [Frigidibacter sp. MR17.14]|uniref:hypothetical protein n=1 Tax=Frigidibacter sp. MR17.14 TaxID=3126509 RepID=UPI003012C96C
MRGRVAAAVGRLGAGAMVALVLASSWAGPVRADAPLRVSVDGRALIVTGPKGYCIDRAGARGSDSGAVVVLGSCAALGGGRARPETGPAILSAAVAFGDRGAAEGLLDRLAAFFGTEAGHAALSRSGDAASVVVLAAERLGPGAGDALVLSVEDSGPGAGVAPQYWRAVLLLRGRLVTLSAMAPQGGTLTPAELRAVLEEFVARMVAVNARVAG